LSSRIIEVLGRIARVLQRNPHTGRQPDESTGQYGERLAARYLGKRGYRIIARNEKNVSGEIDLIAVQWIKGDRVIVFVEVKTWANSQEGAGPADAVDDKKQLRLSNAANVYLRRHRLMSYRSRFDVIEIVLKDVNGKFSIRHFQDAFESAEGA
jgi:putative endonuclease